jgi:hypothetical protein
LNIASVSSEVYRGAAEITEEGFRRDEKQGDLGGRMGRYGLGADGEGHVGVPGERRRAVGDGAPSGQSIPGGGIARRLLGVRIAGGPGGYGRDRGSETIGGNSRLGACGARERGCRDCLDARRQAADHGGELGSEIFRRSVADGGHGESSVGIHPYGERHAGWGQRVRECDRRRRAIVCERRERDVNYGD